MNPVMRTLLFAATLALAMPAVAQESTTTTAAPTTDPLPPPALDETAIGDDAVRGLAGRGAINLAAGGGNVQANLAAIALSPDGTGIVGVHAGQGVELQSAQLPALRGRDASARIDGRAFGDSVGVLSVNQVAGTGNAQLNVFALGNGDVAMAARGLAGLDDATLAVVAGSNPTEEAEAPTGLRHAVIADDAFRGSQGVVQVNQTAGVGNFSTNAIVLQLPGGTP